jgi:hypothetical protein
MGTKWCGVRSFHIPRSCSFAGRIGLLAPTPGEHTAGDVAAVMGRRPEQLGPTRARLIDKGLIYTTGHGRGDFTVPQFDRYMRRNHDLAPESPRR